MVVKLLQIWVIIVVAIMVIYAIRHWIFTMQRLGGRQRPYYQDLFETELPRITVIVPMHNEATVAARCLDSLIESEYPRELLEIIPIDDHSTDGTAKILADYAARYSFVRPATRDGEERGKASSLNLGIELAKSEIVLVFDADYMPGAGLLHNLALAFVDPEVGAVMGRVVPRNTGKSLLTRLLSLERSGGYQVDQQARYNLDLFPQYGGTVGGFRRSIVRELGGFDPAGLAEDTELTARLFVRGWKVVYANRAECYEEVPETWSVRFRQLRRWARGHNRALQKHLFPLLGSKLVSGRQKLDGTLMLFAYIVPTILLSGLAANVALFLMGQIPIYGGIVIAFCVVLYNSFGNFAPIYQVTAAEVLDGSVERIYLVPFMFYLFIFNSWAVTSGLFDVLGDWVKQRRAIWDKTARSETVQDAATP